MLMIKLMMIFLMFSCSCVSIEKGPIYDLELDKLKSGINPCFVRCYDYEKLRIVEDRFCGEGFKSGNLPLEFCNETFLVKKRFFNNELSDAIKFNIRQCKDKQ